LRSILRLASLCVAAVLLGFGFAARPALAQTTPTMTAQAASGPSLYKRLGGYDAIAAVTDDFIKRLATDPDLSKFFVGLSNESKAKVRQLVVDLLCYSTGGPCVYLGRDMKTSHAGLNITEAEWETSNNDFKASLDAFKVGQQEQTELFAMLAKIKPDIVTAPSGK
jgi:hemoglobin